MWLVDQLAEKHIQEAINKGEFDNLPGQGQPLELDDDSFVPEALRVGYRLLKNAGCLPPELLMRKEAVDLKAILKGIDQAHQDYTRCHQRLAVLELKLRLAGMDTSFLHHNQYGRQLRDTFEK